MNFFCVGEFCDTNTRPYSTWQKGLDWYYGRFPVPREGAVRGEYSPDYFCYSGAAKAIHETVPDAKLIVALRNPPDMLESVSRLLRHSGFRTYVPFDESVKRGLYLERGFYFRMLRPFYDLFPHERIHVILYDDIVKGPAGVLRDLFSFLGVDTNYVPPALRLRVNAILSPKPGRMTSLVNLAFSGLRSAGFRRVADWIVTNRTLNRWYMRHNSVETAATEMSATTRSRLKARYRDDIIALQNLIGRDLSAWL